MIDQERLKKGLYWQDRLQLVHGCTKVSPGCDGCWMESESNVRQSNPGVSHRYEGVMDGRDFSGEIRLQHDNLEKAQRKTKGTVYAVWNDLFHEDVPETFIRDAYTMMITSPQHTFLVLTKRAERMAKYFSPENCFQRPNMPNIHHGVTICNQAEADKNVPLLLQVPGNRFLSIEPMLGAIDIMPMLEHRAEYHNDTGIHQVLLGGESGKNARPMHPDWVRTIRDQCESAGVPFFFKQHGEWIVASDYNLMTHKKQWDMRRDGCLFLDIDGTINQDSSHGMSREAFAMIRVGKKNAGRIIDGRTHDQLIWSGK